MGRVYKADRRFCHHSVTARYCLAGLDYQNFEHQHRIKRRTSAFAPISIRKSQLQIRAKHFKVDSPGKRFELITKPVQPSKPQNQRVLPTLHLCIGAGPCLC